MRVAPIVAASIAASVAACVLALLAATPATAGESTDQISVRVTVTLHSGSTIDGTLISGTKDGELTIRTGDGEQKLSRDSWYAVAPARPLGQFTEADRLYGEKKYDEAAKKYESAYTTFEHLYAFGAQALDGQGRSLLQAGKAAEAVAAYEKLFSEYTGADLSPARRYYYGVALDSAGGRDNRDKAITQLEYVADTTDDATTAAALYMLGRLYYKDKRYMQSLRSSLRVIVLYGNWPGGSTQDTVARARQLAAHACEKLSKSTDAALRKRAESIAARLKNL